MQNMPATEATKHFFICGATGSGKSTAIQLFLQSIAPRFRADNSAAEQLILFDAKSDMIPALAAMGLGPEHENVWILNPFDARSAVWNLAEAMTSPSLARHFATLLVPPEPRSTAPYFSDAARDIVYAVILGLNAVHPRHWTLRDLLCALESRRHIEGVAAHDPRAKLLVERHLEDTHHSPNVLSTIGTKVGPLEQVAALWGSSGTARPFSIPKFLERPGVLILGNDAVLRDSFWPINAILLKSLAQHILRGSNSRNPRYWFVLDEFRAMERVDCIHDLLNRGRSKGASVLLGIQSVEGLEEVYQNGTHDILSQCAYKSFLRAGGPKTAAWAEQFFGKVRRTEASYSESSGAGGNSSSIQHAVRERSLFEASFFLSLPFCGLGGEHVSVNDVPWQDCTFVTRRRFDELLSWCKKPDETLVPAVMPRLQVDEQTMRSWSSDEEKYYCLPPESPKSQTDQQRSTSEGAKAPTRIPGRKKKPNT
jgi:type IV secretory pathway TraG/TraD family ATPase VirD4